MSDLTYIRERLDSLYEVDTKLVASLEGLSSVLTTLQKGKTQDRNEELEAEFLRNVGSFYSSISQAAISLRKEIKCLDDKISNTGDKKGDGSDFSILPININKKAVWTGDHKLNQEVGILNELLGESPKEEDASVAANGDDESAEVGNEILME